MPTPRVPTPYYIELGSVFGPIHDHKDRPEDRNTLHWLENRETVPAVEISVDIVGQA